MKNNRLIILFATLLPLLLPESISAQLHFSYDGGGKHLVTRVFSSDGLETEDYRFTYDEQNRLVNVRMDAYYGIYLDYDFNYKWSDNRLNITGTSEGEDFGTLSFGLNSFHCVTSDDSNETKYQYNYDGNGYITSFTEDGKKGTAVWENGDLTYQQCGGFKRVFEYGNIVNTSNIDFAFSGIGMDGFLILPLGKWSKHMPEKVSDYQNGKLIYECVLQYTTDAKGRITRINIDGKDMEDEDEVIDFFHRMDISYDEASGIENVKDCSSKPLYKIFDTDGRRLSKVQKGLNIIVMPDGSVVKRVH